MPQESEICNNSDFSLAVPRALCPDCELGLCPIEDAKSPVCTAGHSWDLACMNHNPCPDYKPSMVVSSEELRETVGLETM